MNIIMIENGIKGCRGGHFSPHKFFEKISKIKVSWKIILSQNS